MATYGKSMTVTYTAWDTSANTGKTGDVANHTLRWIKDGASAVPTNSPSEVDAANAPGEYKVTLTAAEAQTAIGKLAGVSSTANVSIVPVQITFEHIPDAAPDAAGGLPISDAGGLDLDTLLGRLDAAISTRMATFSLPANFAALGINGSGHVSRVVLVDTTTANADMVGTDGANTTTPPTTVAIRDAILDRILSGNHDTASTLGKLIQDIFADTNELQADWADGGRLDLIQDNVSTTVGNLPTAAQVMSQTLTESYAANGVVPTLEQALLAIHQSLMATSYNGKTKSVKQLDGTTEAFSATLDSSSAPTEVIRTS